MNVWDSSTEPFHVWFPLFFGKFFVAMLVGFFYFYSQRNQSVSREDKDERGDALFFCSLFFSLEYLLTFSLVVVCSFIFYFQVVGAVKSFIQ
jgi:hypothetical protein